MKKDYIYILIIICLGIGWISAVYQEQASISNITQLYNHLVNECNTVIHANDYQNFCITYPDGTKECQQNDLNNLLPFINQT